MSILNESDRQSLGRAVLEFGDGRVAVRLIDGAWYVALHRSHRGEITLAPADVALIPARPATPNPDPAPKHVAPHPLGVKPKWLHDEIRARELMRAIGRFADTDYWPSSDWAEELEWLLMDIHDRKAEADLERLRAGVDDPIDFSDIPEQTGQGRKVIRDASGRIVKGEGQTP